MPRVALAFGWLVVSAAPAGAVMPPATGSVPSELLGAFEAGAFALPGPPAELGTSAVQAEWNIPVILVSFSDQPLNTTLYGSETPAQRFTRVLFDTSGATPTGSLFDYYRWVSGRRIRVLGRVVATVTLPEAKNYYAADQWGLGRFLPNNSAGFVNAALQRADSTVDWRPFDRDGDTYVDMVWVVHSGFPGEATLARDNLWSITSQLTWWQGAERFQTRTPVPGAPSLRMLINRFSVLPELSAVRPGQLAEIGTYCHEFGHALGLPDLYDTSTVGGSINMGPGNWSLMGTGSYGADGQSPEYPAHLGAWPLLFLGWRQSIQPTHDTLLVQGPLAQGAPVVEFWFQGESNPERFLIENRQREGFDRNLHGEGLVIYQVDEAVMTLGTPGNRVNAGVTPGLRLVEADGRYDILLGRNRGDPNDPFPGALGRTEIDDDTSPSTRSFRQAVTNTAIRQIEPIGGHMRYFLQVRAPGWQAPVVASTAGFNPIWPSSAANRALLAPDGSLVLAMSELQAGRPQVMLRSRPRHGVWGDPRPVSASPGGATDPCIAALPGGNDLVMAWSDTRHGAGELYYRTRIGGVWSAERRLTALVGDSRFPSLGVDRYGRVHLAWLYAEGASSQVRFMTFTYFSPFGIPAILSGPSDLPDAPVVAVAPGGTSHIFWSDRGTLPAAVRYVRYTVDSGFTAATRLAPGDLAQPAVDAAVDTAGTVHVVWQASGAGVNQIRYQRRRPGIALPSPFDTVIVSRGESIQNPTLRADPGSGVHLVFIASSQGVQQVRYKHWEPGRGWDYASTEVTAAADGPTARPAIIPAGLRDVSVLYLGFPGGVVQQMERRRSTWEGPVAVSLLTLPPAWAGLRLGPNPLRAGEPLRMRLASDGEVSARAVDIFDLAGRRLVTVPLTARGGEWFAELPGQVTLGWSSGIYFARPQRHLLPATRLVVLR